jgi:hypothetical protein
VLFYKVEELKVVLNFAEERILEIWVLSNFFPETNIVEATASNPGLDLPPSFSSCLKLLVLPQRGRTKSCELHGGEKRG